MARLRKVWRRFTGWLTGPRVAALLLGVLGVLIGFGGYLYRYCECQGWPNLVAGWEQFFLDFYANAATTFVGFTVAVLTIDLLNERRATGSYESSSFVRCAAQITALRFERSVSLERVVKFKMVL